MFELKSFVNFKHYNLKSNRCPKMKTKIIYILPILFLAACMGNNETETKPAPLYPQPQTIATNIEGGYTTNTLTGDTIHPIIFKSVDTLITGIPITVTGKVIHPDSVAMPKIVLYTPSDSIYNAHPNVYKIPNDLTVIPVNKDSLTKILLPKISKNDTTHYLVNNTGDTIKSGVPILAKGKTVVTLQPHPTPALPSRFKNDAINNMQYLDVDQGMPSSYVNCVYEDKSGNLWFGTNGGGVSKYDGESFMHYTEKEGLNNNDIVSILEDKSGNIWFGTYGGGVSKYDGESFIHYTEKEGLSNNDVWSILEDKSGNIWFGTYGGGVSKYDPSAKLRTGSESFTHYTEKEGLSSNYVRSILEDKSGNLWFGTYGGGVSKYDGESFIHYTEKEGLSNNYVRSILEDESGNLWFATNGGGVSKYDPSAKLRTGSESFTHYTEKEGLSNNYVWSILEDKSGNLWFGTKGGGVSKYDGESFIHYTEKEGLSNNVVLSILEDKSGNLWFGTSGGGVSKLVLSGVEGYDGESFIHYTEKEGLSNNYVLSILEDKSGNLWFGTYGGGVSKYDPSAKLRTGSEGFTHYIEKQGLSSNYVFSILEDKSGNLWFGTNGGGVSKYDRESFIHYTEKEGLSNDYILSILEDKSGNLWFGTDVGGVSKYDGESFIHYAEKEGLSNNTVLTILEDKSGNLWFGTYGGGVSKYDGKSFIHYTEKEGLSNNYVLSILEDKSGNLWFGTNGGGVSKYDGESFTHYTEKEGLSNNVVRSILEDKSGSLWFGTNGGGVSKLVLSGVEGYDGESFIHYTEKEGLSNNYVLSILQDKRGNLWFGTNGGGVSKLVLSGVEGYVGESFIHYTEKEGLSNNYVLSILEDKSGNLWATTDNGLNELVFVGGADAVQAPNEKKSTKVTFSAKRKEYEIITFGKQDGLKGLDFFVNSAFIDSKNRAWWGSGKSLTMLDMNQFALATHPLGVSMSRLEINEHFLDYRNLTDSIGNAIIFNGVQQFENYPLNLKLPYYKNHLTFYFSAIDWSAPHKIQYSYFMEGLNTNWSQPSNEAKADYRNIPYGTFTFKVRAIGISGEWSEPFAYEFTIHPPWWHTWWARTGYAIAALLLIFGFVKWRTAKLKERQKELETEVEIATKDLTHKNIEIEKQKEQVEEAHKEITDSINYAERIQRSFLATDDLLSQNLNDYFVFFQPKDVVSGDFYWAGKLSNGDFAMVNADSTGHGVPGAIMSILNISSIEEAIKEGSTAPSQIFNKTRNFIIERLKKDGSPEGGKDGMDASIICFDFEKNKFSYTAAQNPIWIIRGEKLIEIKPEKMPIGKHDKDNIPFVGGEFEIQKGDQIYTLTDGFQDQFGGPKSKKFMVKNLREYVLSISHLPMQEQYQKFKETFTNWKGDIEQVDDVCVIGVKI
jgi:ligand-binding sensor domain-containing protein/serine phosphatase RsbU (regulator of sigma subunit)